MQTKLFIDGGWMATARSLPVINPATEAAIARIPAGAAPEAEAAVRAARAAFDHGPWPRMTGAERARVLRRASATGCPNWPGWR